MKKRGISPLIATVILVSFSVALGAVIINWSGNMITQQADDVSERTNQNIKCSLDMKIRILEIDDEMYICYNRSNSNNLEVIVENYGNEDAAGVQIFLLDNNDDPVTHNVLTPVDAHDREKYNISLGSEFAFPPNKVLISAIESGTETNVNVCTNNRIDIEEIEQCS